MKRDELHTFYLLISRRLIINDTPSPTNPSCGISTHSLIHPSILTPFHCIAFIYSSFQCCRALQTGPINIPFHPLKSFNQRQNSPFNSLDARGDNHHHRHPSSWLFVRLRFNESKLVSKITAYRALCTSERTPSKL